MTTALQLLDAARAEIGIVEGPGSNNVKYNTEYYGRNVTGNNYAWCQVFAWWIGVRTSATHILPAKTAWTPGAAQWYKDRGQWGTAPQVGAQVFYNISGLGRISHTGWVEHVNSDGSWNAIEGNTDSAGGRTGGRVMRQHRSRLGIGGGFGYPKYDGPSVPLGPAPVASGAIRQPQLPPTFRRGDRGHGWIYLIQTCLNIESDGIFGGGTDAAVRAQQARFGLAVDGVVGPWTWVSFIAAAGRVLSRGDAHRHPGIEVLQNMLGFRGPELDRDFGSNTEERVMQVQRYGGVKPDGVVGEVTRAVLARG